jgi:hypothetical protein
MSEKTKNTEQVLVSLRSKQPATRTVDDENDAIAKELIRVFFTSLRDLVNGGPVPQRWLDEIAKHLNKRAGVKPATLIMTREQAWARAMQQHREAIASGTSLKSVTAFAESLAKDASTNKQLFDSKDVFKAERKWERLVLAERASHQLNVIEARSEQRRRDRRAEIDRRLSIGESLDDMVADPQLDFDLYVAIRSHQEDPSKPIEGSVDCTLAHSYNQRRHAILKWLSVGESLGVGHDPPPLLNLREARRRDLSMTPRVRPPKPQRRR